MSWEFNAAGFVWSCARVTVGYLLFGWRGAVLAALLLVNITFGRELRR